VAIGGPATSATTCPTPWASPPRRAGDRVDERYLQQARWAAGYLDPNDRIDFRHGSVYELADLHERFDVVLFLGVLYHLRHPLLALDLVSECVGDRLIFQTLTMPGHQPIEAPTDVPIDGRHALTEPGWPRAAFIEGQLAGDPTNWWAPDDACVQAMIRSAGLRVTAAPGHEIYVCQAGAEDPARDLRQQELGAVFRR
jgi:tRNA (mo5U34)-methyltransferase